MEPLAQCSPTNGKNNCVHNWKYIEGELLLKRETLFVILKYLILHRTVKREGRVLPMIRISGKIGVYPYELALEISLGIVSIAGVVVLVRWRARRRA